MFNRYLLAQFWKMFILLLLGWIFVFVILDLVGNMQTWLKRPSHDAIEYYKNYIPHITWLVMPVSMLLTVITVVGGLARHLELSALKTAGISILKILWPVFLSAFLVTLFAFYLGDRILPNANHKRLAIAQLPSESKKVTRETTKYDFVYIGAQGKGYYFEQYDADLAQGRNVTLIYKDLNGNINERFDANVMRFDTNQKKWLLENSHHRSFSLQNNSVSKATYAFENQFTLDLKHAPELPQDFIDTRFSPDEMSINDLKNKIKSLKRVGEKTFYWETQWHFKWSGPFVNFIMAVIAIALCHNAIRGGLPKLFGIGLAIIFSYYILIKIGLVFGENGALPSVLAAWSANILFGTLAMILLRRSIRL